LRNIIGMQSKNKGSGIGDIRLAGSDIYLICFAIIRSITIIASK
jgi:hypothetical protein